MEPDPRLFVDLALVFLAATVGGALAWWARQPLVLGYVLGGLAVSPFTPGLGVGCPLVRPVRPGRGRAPDVLEAFRHEAG